MVSIPTKHLWFPITLVYSKEMVVNAIVHLCTCRSSYYVIVNRLSC